MTVRELLKALEKLPQDLRVLVPQEGTGSSQVPDTVKVVLQLVEFHSQKKEGGDPSKAFYVSIH